MIVASPLEIVDRPQPPRELNDEERRVWIAVTAAEPADWFTESTLPLLIQYCRHVVQARRVAELIERAASEPELDVKDYDRLLAMQDRESRALATLAGKMRVSQSAVINHRANRKAKAIVKPWDSEEPRRSQH
jgi:hypothetical protein